MVLLFRNLIIIKAFRKCATSQNRIHQISSPYIPARLGEGLRGSREFNFEVQFPIKNQAAFRSSSKTTCGSQAFARPEVQPLFDG